MLSDRSTQEVVNKRFAAREIVVAFEDRLLVEILDGLWTEASMDQS